jgi:hypothetical protein
VKIILEVRVNSDNNLVYSVFERVIGVESKSYGKKVESVILKKKNLRSGKERRLKMMKS